jgi:hypothetical protein
MMSDKPWHFAGPGPGRTWIMFGAAWMLTAGCSTTWDRLRPNGWAADYDTAEARVRESGRERLIYYHPTDQGLHDPTFDALRSGPLRQQTAPFVLCSLFRSYERDRRYAAQFGVERAPALIVVHRDGTYHARTGEMSAPQIAEFLAAAEAPGTPPVVNPHIPREPNYVWYGSLESAETAARKTGQSILIVLDRWWPGDRRKLKKLLEHREVYSRFADMVHCRPGSIWGPADKSITRFGVVNLPALVILHPDGAHQVLELPTSYEAVVRFADRARATGGGTSATSTTTTAGPHSGGE